MATSRTSTLSSGAVELWGQGRPGKLDGITPDGRQGHMNEQVIWVRHTGLDDHRSAFRVPEGIGWRGKRMVRVDQLTPTNHHYQIGQDWRRSSDRLEFTDCPISDMFDRSPGTVAATVEFVEDEVVRMEMAITNTQEGPLEAVKVQFCWNHRRAPLLGRRIFAMSDSGWADFSRYIVDPPFRKYHFVVEDPSEENPKELLQITRPLILSEALHENGVFATAIGSEDAKYIMSNWEPPCTDTALHFGTIQPGESERRSLFLGLGFATKDDWLARMSRYVGS